MFRVYIFKIFLILCGFAIAAEAKITIPEESKVLINFGHCSSEFLKSPFQLLLWNVKKGEAKDQWAIDFDRFAKQSQLILIQEAMDDHYMSQILNQYSETCWHFAISFSNQNNESTGVLTGSPVIVADVDFLRSPGREPFLHSPKMVLLTEYFLPQRLEKLLVVNVHALNFVLDSKNKQQIDQIVERIQGHQGPMIVAGDFNSWNKNRIDYIFKKFATLGLVQKTWDHDDRILKLDHIFVRGISADFLEMHEQINSSDHKPITAQLRIL